MSVKNTENIKLIVRKNNQWFVCKDVNQPFSEKDIVRDVPFFLSQNKCFIKINASVIANLTHVSDYQFSETQQFIIISKKIFIISRRFILDVNIAYTLFHKQPSIPVEYNKPLSNITYSPHGTHKPICFEKATILYLNRVGSLTQIIYQGGGVLQMYKTLKYFEDIFLENSSFIRINRNNIINTEYLKSYQINIFNRTGEVQIESITLPISRRLLPQFKEKYLTEL